MALFNQFNVSEMIMVIEEEDKPPFPYSQQDATKRLDDKKFKDGTVVTKVSVIEHFVITTKQEFTKTTESDKR